MKWLTPETLIKVMGFLVAFMSLIRLKTQKQSTEKIEKAIQDVRQSIRRSSALICLAIVVLALAVLAKGLNIEELHP